MAPAVSAVPSPEEPQAHTHSGIYSSDSMKTAAIVAGGAAVVVGGVVLYQSLKAPTVTPWHGRLGSQSTKDKTEAMRAIVAIDKAQGQVDRASAQMVTATAKGKWNKVDKAIDRVAVAQGKHNAASSTVEGFLAKRGVAAVDSVVKVDTIVSGSNALRKIESNPKWEAQIDSGAARVILNHQAEIERQERWVANAELIEQVLVAKAIKDAAEAAAAAAEAQAATPATPETQGE